MLMKRMKTVVIIVAFFAVLALLAFTINENINKKVFVKEYTFTHENLPSAFDESKSLFSGMVPILFSLVSCIVFSLSSCVSIRTCQNQVK